MRYFIDTSFLCGAHRPPRSISCASRAPRPYARPIANSHVLHVRSGPHRTADVLLEQGPIPARGGCIVRRTDAWVIPNDHHPADAGALDAAFDLYRGRRDKTYSMVDCIGMAICAQQKITEVLTADNDFAQEGLTVLLA